MTDIISFNCNDLKKCISSFKNIVYQFKMMKKGKKKLICNFLYNLLSHRDCWQFLAVYSYRAMVAGYKI